MPPRGMRPVLLAVLLVSVALQGSAAQGTWYSWFTGKLDHVQDMVQQRQAQYLRQQQPTTAAVIAAHVEEPLQRSLLQQPTELAETAASGSYGYGYGYGYGGYGYGYGYADSTGDSVSSNSRRRLQEAPSGLAPTIIYDNNPAPATQYLLQARIEAGMSHTDGIVLDIDAPAALSETLEQSTEKKAARKLLLTASNIRIPETEPVVLPMEPLVLEPVDELLAGRSLLQDSDAGSYGGYGYGDYGYGGYGYGYGASVAAEPAGRSLLQAAEVDDVQLYNIWLQNRLQRTN